MSIASNCIEFTSAIAIVTAVVAPLLGAIKVLYKKVQELRDREIERADAESERERSRAAELLAELREAQKKMEGGGGPNG